MAPAHGNTYFKKVYICPNLFSMRSRYTTLALLWLSLSLSAQQNLQLNYTPLKSTGTLPEVFTQDIKKVISADLATVDKKTDEDGKLKSTYYAQANYEIEKIVRSGNTLINDEITVYLNKLADVLLKDKPSLRKELSIYTYKSPVVNAYSYDKGYIYIDIGLVAQAETEAQLAYILSHEIAHYTKKHNIQGYIQNKKIDSDRYTDYDDKLAEKCQYSKEHESEADIEGFKLYELSNYDLAQAEKAFGVLQYAHLPFELVEFKKSFLETEHFKIPAAYQLKEVSSIRNNANQDDSKNTHPNTARRKTAISALIKASSNTGKTNYIIGETDFMYVRDLARFELCRLYLKRRDYPNAFYASYILQQKYPNNQYLVEVTAKCLYAVSLYDKGDLRYGSDSYLENGIESHNDIESYPQQIYYLINKMPGNEWTIMATNYIYRHHKLFPNSKPLAALSDSMLVLIRQVSWGITDFVRTNKHEEEKPAKKDSSAAPATRSKTDMIASIQHENNFRKYDTAYYKSVFVDLFMNDPGFVKRFPTSSEVQAMTSGSGFADYHPGEHIRSEERDIPGKVAVKPKITKVLLLDPFYAQVDLRSESVNMDASYNKQEKLRNMLNYLASRRGLELVVLDPASLKSSDVDKINDYSVINDWFAERFDGEKNNRTLPVLNTDQVGQVVSNYATPYVMKVGVVTLRGGRKRTLFYTSVVDLNTGKEIYHVYDIMRGADREDILNMRLSTMLTELTKGK